MDLTQEVIKTWGPAGIIISALAYATVTLWKRSTVIQDLRINEANERAKALGDVAKEAAVAMVSMSDALNSLREMIARLDR